ncbi:hypothetical protein C0991_002431 [Blastosporella zonata]|nr:hypothetical protein C0991_002431 [Blastosporella zonata]
MANGPPTPPPTTEAEIQDEARASAENPANATITAFASASPPSIQPDAFQATFPTIVNLASQSDFRRLIEVAENANINVCDPTTQTRLPDIISSTPLITYLVELMASTWDRKHAKVYSRAQELFNLVHQPGFFDEQLASVLTSLVSTFIHSFRQRTVALLSTAYTSLPLPLAQEYLGMEQVELLAGESGQGCL